MIFLKKSVDKCGLRWYIRQALERAGQKSSKVLLSDSKKVLKKIKKVLDKLKSLMYNNKAVAERAQQGNVP